MFSSELGKTLWGGEWAGVEGGNSLKSISETQPEFQVLQIKKHYTHTLVEVM